MTFSLGLWLASAVFIALTFFGAVMAARHCDKMKHYGKGRK